MLTCSINTAEQTRRLFAVADALGQPVERMLDALGYLLGESDVNPFADPRDEQPLVSVDTAR